jgi:hypothetical protein
VIEGFPDVTISKYLRPASSGELSGGARHLQFGIPNETIWQHLPGLLIRVVELYRAGSLDCA